MISAGKHTAMTKHGVELNRFYIIDREEDRFTKDHEDELGTVAFWEEAIDEIIGAKNYSEGSFRGRGMPFSQMTEGLVLNIYDAHHPELDRMRERKEAGLEDYNPATKECEGASGLYFADKFKTNKHRIDIAVRRDGHTYDQKNPTSSVEAHNLYVAIQVLGHEMGHLYMRICMYWGYESTFGHEECNRIFDNLRVKHIESPHEAGAEMFQAICGIHEIRGKFSDKEPHKMSPEQITFILVWLWLQAKLSGVVFSDLTVSGQWVWWKEYEWKTTWFFKKKMVSKGWFSVNRDWVSHKWHFGKWVKK